MELLVWLFQNWGRGDNQPLRSAVNGRPGVRTAYSLGPEAPLGGLRGTGVEVGMEQLLQAG